MNQASESILQESKKSRLSKKQIAIGALVILIGLLIFFGVRGSNGEDVADTESQVVEVKKGNILVSVEGEGKVINPNIVNLSFLINGTLKNVEVEQGQRVQQGDVIAQLDPRDFNFDLRDAQSQVNIVRANIKSKEAELTDLSLRLAQDELISSQQALENAQRDYEQALDQAYQSARIELDQVFPTVEEGLRKVDEIFSIDRQESIYSSVVSAFNDNARENQIENLYRSTKFQRDQLWNEYQQSSPIPEDQLNRFLLRAKSLTLATQDLLEQTMILFDGAIPSSVADQSLIDSAESSVSSSLSSVESEATAVNNILQSIEDARLNQKNGIINAERSLENTQLKLENSERDFDRLQTTKQASLSVLYAQLAQAQVRVEKAKYNLSLTTLLAPIDGEVTIVNGKPGETIKAETASSENAFVRILSEDNFTTEVYIEEVDIARIREGQAAKITLDALPDTELEGLVDYVSSTSTIDNNGVTTYLVRVEITDKKEAPIREGMTTYVEFVEHQALDALLVPASAIVNDRFVFDENGERVRVRVGITDDRMTEIYEGLTEGQKIMSRPPGTASENRGRGGSSRPPQGGGGDMSTEDRMKLIGDRLRENGMLPDGWDQMSTAQKQKALEQMRESRGGFGGGRR